MKILRLAASALIGVASSAPSFAVGSEPVNQPEKMPMSSKKLPLPPHLIKVPLSRQATSYTCGVSALQSVLAFWGEEVREDVLAKSCKSDKRIGTAYQRIADCARSKGFAVEIRKNLQLAELKSILDKKQPVICLIQAWPEREVNYATDWEDGHYVVAIGYDAHNMYFMDPSTLGHYTYIPTGEFEKRWHDTDGKEKLFNFGMLVSKDTPRYNPEEVTLLE